MRDRYGSGYSRNPRERRSELSRMPFEKLVAIIDENFLNATSQMSTRDFVNLYKKAVGDDEYIEEYLLRATV